MLRRKLPFAALQPGYRNYLSSQAFATAAAAKRKRPWATASALLFSAFVGFSTSWYVYKYLDGQKNATGSTQGGTNSLTARYAAVDKMQAVRRTAVDGLLCMCVSHRLFRSNSTICGQAILEIRRSLGDESVSTDDEDLLTHGYSVWSTVNPERLPIAVAYPKSTQEVSKIVKICHKYRVPMSMHAPSRTQTGGWLH